MPHFHLHLRPRLAVLIAAGVLLVAATACGNGGDDDTGSAADAADRTVEIAMVDVAFEPDAVTVAKGETVRFVFTNEGKTPHEAYLGSGREQRDHEEEMRDRGGSKSGGHHMDGMGGDERAVTVDPGDTGEVTTTFDEAGTFELGCHQPGHYSAGMKLTVTVT